MGEDAENASKQRKGGGVYLSQNVIAIIILISVCFLFTIGMISGFVFRKINACPDPNASTADKPTTVAPITTTTSAVTRTIPTLSTLSTTTQGGVLPPAIYDNVRLPDIFDPYNYDLKIRILFDPADRKTARDNTEFDGEIDMYFNLKQATNEILFHADPKLEVLDIIKILNLDTNEEIRILDQVHRPVKNEYYYLNLNRTINAGRYKMGVNFRGLYKSLYGNKGLYAVHYLDDLVERTMVATNFAPTNARKVFPCFDEPQLKATFNITIDHPLRTFALSNYPQVSNQTFDDPFNPDKFIQTRFALTAKMSTFLVSFAIVPNMYTFEEMRTAKGIPVRVYAKGFAKTSGQLTHALNVAKQSIDFFENEYLGISDAIPPKIDLIAIPDFVGPFSATEGWGLLGFREDAILYSEKNDRTETKQIVAQTVAHEIANLWFGNLVTCKWWSDLWLDEGVATFLEYKAIEKIFPKWEIQDQFITSEYLDTMWDDGYASSHPLVPNVNTSNDAISIFDSITFSKGAAVLRMLESVVGATELQNGLKRYLNNNKFGLSNPTDLYGSLRLPSDMTGTTSEQYMDTWLKQMNYPSVFISLSRDAQAQRTNVNFIQSRFLYTVYNEEINPQYVSPYDYTWQIYLHCKAGGVSVQNGDESQHLQGNEVSFTYFLNSRNGQFQIPVNRFFTWVKCNTDFKSYYVTDYSKAIYEGLDTVLRREQERFSVSDRANLLHVTYQLAYEGVKSYSYAAILAEYLEYNERNFVPWKVFMWHMDLIVTLMEHRPLFKQLSFFGTGIVATLGQDLDFYQESTAAKEHLNILLETNALEFLCRMQTEQCLRKSTEFFTQIPEIYFLYPNQEANPVPKEIRKIVYKYHLQNTYNYNDWFDIYELYEDAGDAQVKSDALVALTQTRSTWIINYYLTEILRDDSPVKNQDFFIVLDTLARNPSGRHLAWYFYRHFWDDMVRKFGLSDLAFGSSITPICESFDTLYLLDDMFDFFASHPNAGVGAGYRQEAIDIVENNVFYVLDRENDLESNLIDPLLKRKNIKTIA